LTGQFVADPFVRAGDQSDLAFMIPCSHSVITSSKLEGERRVYDSKKLPAISAKSRKSIVNGLRQRR
jgi:hypothetical protein